MPYAWEELQSTALQPGNRQNGVVVIKRGQFQSANTALL